MKTIIIANLLLLACSATIFAKQPSSLRGNVPIKEEGKAKMVFLGYYTNKSDFNRTLHQAPMIPHVINHYSITKAKNSCLSCHSQAKSQVVQTKAQNKLFFADSHLVGYNGRKEKKLDKRWYFCNQCHAPQYNVEPLSENK